MKCLKVQVENTERAVECLEEEVVFPVKQRVVGPRLVKLGKRHSIGLQY